MCFRCYVGFILAGGTDNLILIAQRERSNSFCGEYMDYLCEQRFLKVMVGHYLSMWHGTWRCLNHGNVPTIGRIVNAVAQMVRHRHSLQLVDVIPA